VLYIYCIYQIVGKVTVFILKMKVWWPI